MPTHANEERRSAPAHDLEGQLIVLLRLDLVGAQDVLVVHFNFVRQKTGI
jgi:hypothetical protein